MVRPDGWPVYKRLRRQAQSETRGHRKPGKANRRGQAEDNAHTQWTLALRARPRRGRGDEAEELSTHMGLQEEQHNGASYSGSLDGDGAGDHDQAYRFGWR